MAKQLGIGMRNGVGSVWRTSQGSAWRTIKELERREQKTGMASKKGFQTRGDKKMEREDQETMMDSNRSLATFLDASPNGYFAVKNLAQELKLAGYIPLVEAGPWQLQPGNGYYCIRDGSSLVAFFIPQREYTGFQIMASHCDSPAFRIKPQGEITVENRYVKLNVEKYGGAILETWFDRPLSVAGRLLVRRGSGIESLLINVQKDLLIIPNLAIHMCREMNDGLKRNIQKELLPLFSMDLGENSFLEYLAEQAGVEAQDILDTDLFLYNRMKATPLGKDQEFLGSPRLDDLQCAFASFLGLLRAKPKTSIPVCALFDNEEVGSQSLKGAGSNLLSATLKRIHTSLLGEEKGYLEKLSCSFLVSADNAHGVHPNFPEKADPTNRPYLNGGIVIKYSANQKYSTDGVSGALFRLLCERAGVPYQIFANRSDMVGGSTLGNISLSQVGVHTVDVGLPQLAMHSSFETGGVLDTDCLVEAASALFSTSLRVEEDEGRLLSWEGEIYQIQRATEKDVKAIVDLIDRTHAQMEDPSQYVREADDSAWLLEHIREEKKGLVLKAVSAQGELASFLLVDYPGLQEKNLGRDLNFALEELPHVAHMDSCMVDKSHRGNHLETRLLLAAEHFLPVKYKYLLSTVSPENPASYRSMEGAGYERMCVKEKYGGLSRCIYQKLRRI